MDFLRLLLSFLAKELKNGEYAPLFEAANANNFDIKKLLKNIDLEKIMPLIQSLFQNFGEKKDGAFRSHETDRLKPIASIADKDIVYVLNRYFSAADASY